MENIPLILDRILTFASHETYELKNGLELMRVLPRVDLPGTHRHVIRHLVDMYDLGSAGQLELLRLLDSPCRTGTLAAFADAAATAGHAHVLAWLLSVSLTLLQLSEQGHPVDSPLQNIVRNTIVYGRMRVLDWCAAHGADIRTELLFSVASHHSQRHSLGWLKAHSIKHGLDYAFETPARNFLPVTADRLVAMLDWWKAEYTARPEPLFLAYAEFRPEYAWFAEDGLRVVDWWHDYCSEVGHEFTWPAFTTTTLWYLARQPALVAV